MTGLLSLGDIRRIVPSRQSPHADEAERRVRKLATRWRIKPHHFADYNTMSRFLYPSAIDVSRLTAVCAVHSTFFFIDDLFFDTDQFDARDFGIAPEVRASLSATQSFLSDLMTFFGGAAPPKNATTIQDAFYELGRLVAGETRPEWFRVFRDGIQDYLDAVLQREVDLRAGRVVVTDIESFLALRARDTGGLHTCQLIELALGAFLSDSIRDHERVRRLTALAIETASYTNDIFSFHKDVVVEKSEFNLVKILMELQSLSFEAAVHASVELVNARADAFGKAEAELKSWGHGAAPLVARYARGLAEMMSGNVEWHATSNRYRSPDSPFVELRTRT